MGCGTGLLALMLAQRTEENCQIQAVELDPLQQNKHKKTSIIQCGKIVFLIQTDIQHFYKPLQTFDLIVANPPYFFEQGIACKNEERIGSLYQASHLNWLEWAATPCRKMGEISFVCLMRQAKRYKIHHAFCIKQTNVITKIGEKRPRECLTPLPNNPKF